MNLKIYEKIMLSNFSTFKIGGKARFLAIPEDINQIFEAVDFCKKRSLKPFFFGSGANILFPDKPEDDIFFISLKYFTDFEIENDKIILSSGFPLTLIPFLFSSLTNIDNLFFLYLLPGTVGSATYINVRYDKYDFGPFISKIIYLDIDDLKIKEIDGSLAEFSYKYSIFQKKNWIILKVVFDINILSKNYEKTEQKDKYGKLKEFIMRKIILENQRISRKATEIESDIKKFYKIFGLKYIKKYLKRSFDFIDSETFSQMKKIEDYRLSKFHFSYPSCGSVFKNNYSFGTPTGALVDRLGLKGLKHNDAQIAPYHGNIIINVANAKAKDVLYLIEFVQEKIYKNFGFVPEPEIILFRR